MSRATLVIRFGEGADSSAYVAAEWDGLLNADADGNLPTSWLPGDQPWFWVQHDPSLRVGSIVPTGRSGDVVDCGLTSRNVEKEEVTWTEEGQAIELQRLPDGMPTIAWYGEPGTGLARSIRSLTVAAGIPCTGDASYPYTVHLYRYHPPQLSLSTEQDTYRTVLVITMEAAE